MTKGLHKTVASLFIIALALALMPEKFAGAASDPKINEFSASTTGTDVEYVEIFGTPNTDYSAYTVLEIEGDTTGSGVVDEVISIGTTDANGFYLVNLPANALENGSLTLLLVSNFTGALTDDLDTNDDGVFDVLPWDVIVDAVAVNDGGGGDIFYGAPVLGPNYDGLSSFAPGGASRYPDGFDTESATDWVRNDFDLAGIPGFSGTPVVGEAFNTPGETNELVTIVDLGITKTDGLTSVAPGQAVTYTIAVTNSGPSNATGATVTDVFPVVLTAVAWTCVGSGGATCAASGSGNISDTINIPAGGTATYTVNATVSASAAGTMVNTAIVEAPMGITDPVPGNNNATDIDTITAKSIAVPTTTEWGMIVFISLAGLGSVYYLRRHRRA